MPIIDDPTRVLSHTEAAMIWLGLDPTDADVIDKNSRQLIECSMYLAQAAESGALRYYDKELLQEIPLKNTQRTEKVHSYRFTMQALLDFARLKKHQLGKKPDAACAGVTADKALSTTERNSLLTIIAALCDYSAVDVKKRGAAAQIAGMTEDIGARVSEDTVRRVLDKIVEAGCIQSQRR